MTINFNELDPEDEQALEAEVREYLLAEQAEQFIAYCCSDELFGKEQPLLHHAMLCQHLQQLADGKLERLMIFMPPGSAKSTYTSVRFASWYLGRYCNGVSSERAAVSDARLQSDRGQPARCSSADFRRDSSPRWDPGRQVRPARN